MSQMVIWMTPSRTSFYCMRVILQIILIGWHAPQLIPTFVDFLKKRPIVANLVVFCVA